MTILRCIMSRPDGGLRSRLSLSETNAMPRDSNSASIDQMAQRSSEAVEFPDRNRVKLVALRIGHEPV